MLAFKLLHGFLDADVDRLKIAITYRIASRWNNLPTSVKDASSVLTFKQKLLNHFIITNN